MTCTPGSSRVSRSSRATDRAAPRACGSSSVDRSARSTGESVISASWRLLPIATPPHVLDDGELDELEMAADPLRRNVVAERSCDAIRPALATIADIAVRETNQPAAGTSPDASSNAASRRNRRRPQCRSNAASRQSLLVRAIAEDALVHGPDLGRPVECLLAVPSLYPHAGDGYRIVAAAAIDDGQGCEVVEAGELGVEDLRAAVAAEHDRAGRCTRAGLRRPRSLTTRPTPRQVRAEQLGRVGTMRAPRRGGRAHQASTRRG